MRRIQKSLGHGGKTGILGTCAPRACSFDHAAAAMRIKRTIITVHSCACDVPSHNYTWSFEPKTDWSGTYASSKEIFNYFDTFARKYGLRQYCRTQHEVVSASWNVERHGYEVRVRDLNSGHEWDDSCDILINAGGILNSWRWPAIPGLDRFKGTKVHTANWDESIALEGKHVGLIGNG